MMRTPLVLVAHGSRDPRAAVANRALAPSSKLAAAGWVNRDVHIPGLSEVSDDACYRAMDWLLAVEPALAKDVYASTADLLNLQVDLLFFDTTSTYFETETGDEESLYEVEVTRDDGSQVDVQLDRSFNVVGSAADDESEADESGSG